jgi:hypothetical protein
VDVEEEVEVAAEGASALAVEAAVVEVQPSAADRAEAGVRVLVVVVARLQ